MSPRDFYWGINWASVLTHVKYHPRLSWTSHPSSFSLWRVCLCLCLCICLCHFPVQISNWVQSNHLKIKVVACPDVFRLPIKTWKCFWQVQMSKRRRRYFSNVLYWAAHPKFVKLAPVFPKRRDALHSLRSYFENMRKILFSLSYSVQVTKLGIFSLSVYSVKKELYTYTLITQLQSQLCHNAPPTYHHHTFHSHVIKISPKPLIDWEQDITISPVCHQ